MTDLDLTSDPPEEYEGRTVRWNSAEYVIGPWIGEGGERIVHRFVNRKSGLTLFLIKILRDQEFGPDEARAMFESWDDARMHGLDDAIVPTPELVYAHGGWFEIAEAANCESDPQCSSLERARTEYKEGSYSAARNICTAILEANRYHTEALHLLARITADEGRLDDAIELGDQTLSIEPNARPYRFTLMESLARRGYLRRFQALYKELKEKWPGEKACSPLAAEVLLALGRPEEASRLEILPSATKASLQEKIADEVSLARRAKALESDAYGLLKTDPDRVLQVLQNAHDLYSKDTFISINYGLALQRAGRWPEAYDLLIGVTPKLAQDAQLPWGLHDSIIANAAVALIYSDRLSEASELLVRLWSNISDPSGHLEYWDLPGVLTWVSDPGGQIVEIGEPPKTMGRLIRKVLEDAQAVGGVGPAELAALIRVYEAEPRPDD